MSSYKCMHVGACTLDCGCVGVCVCVCIWANECMGTCVNSSELFETVCMRSRPTRSLTRVAVTRSEYNGTFINATVLRDSLQMCVTLIK